MVRVKILQDYKDYRKGQIVICTPNEAFGLMDRGIGIVSKDMVAADYTVVKKSPVSKPEQEGN